MANVERSYIIRGEFTDAQSLMEFLSENVLPRLTSDNARYMYMDPEKAPGTARVSVAQSTLSSGEKVHSITLSWDEKQMDSWDEKQMDSLRSSQKLWSDEARRKQQEKEDASWAAEAWDSEELARIVGYDRYFDTKEEAAAYAAEKTGTTTWDDRTLYFTVCAPVEPTTVQPGEDGEGAPDATEPGE